MQKIDHKHFTNNVFKTMNGLQDAAANVTEKETNFKYIINNDKYFLFTNNNPFKFITNLDGFRIADMHYQNQHFSDEKVIIDDTKNDWIDIILDVIFDYSSQMPICLKEDMITNYQDLVSLRYNENILGQNTSQWIFLQFVGKCSNNGNLAKMIQLYECTESSKKNVKTSQYGTLSTKGNLTVVPYSYYYIIITVQSSDCKTLSNTIICCTNTTVRRKTQKTEMRHDRHTTLDVPNIVERHCEKSTSVACVQKQKRNSNKLTQFSNFLRILLFCAHTPKKARTGYNNNNAVSLITHNWYIQDIIHGYILDMLQKKMKAKILYYITKQYFVIVVNFTPNLIIEVNKKVNKCIFTIYNNNLYQEICDWYTVGKSICIDTMEKVTKFFVKILQQESIIEAITFTKSYQKEIDFVQINRLSEHKCVENVMDKKQILDCMSFAGELNDVTHETSKYTSNLATPAYVSEAFIETPFDCIPIKANESCMDIYEKRSESDYLTFEIEEINDFFYDAITADSNDIFNETNAHYNQTINVVEADLPVSEYQPTIDFEPIEIIENYTDNQYIFSESESFSKLSKSAISLQKVKGQTFLKDDNDSGISKTNQTGLRKSDVGKFIDNVFEENHNIYNAYYLHSKHWLRKLFKEPQVKAKFDYQDLFACQQLDWSELEISENGYINWTKNYPFQLHRHERLKTATEFYLQNHARMQAYYITFFKCLGKSMLNIFCNVNI